MNGGNGNISHNGILNIQIEISKCVEMEKKDGVPDIEALYAIKWNLVLGDAGVCNLVRLRMITSLSGVII